MISDGKNNFPWKANITELNKTGYVKITAPSGLAAVKTPGFRVRVAEKGKPNLNIVTTLEDDFVCQPAIKDPYFQVWGDSIKIEDKTPYLWEVERDHKVDYTRIENGLKVEGKGIVLEQSTRSMAESIHIVGEGRFGISINSEGQSIEEGFSGTTDIFLDTSRFPENGEYNIKVFGRSSSFILRQLGNGECINGLKED